MGSCPTVNTCKHSSLQLFPQRIYQPTNLHSKCEKVHAKQPFSYAFLGNTIALQIETFTTQIHEPQWLTMVAQGFGDGSRWWLLMGLGLWVLVVQWFCPHTLGRYPRLPQTPTRKKLLQKLLVKGEGIFQGYVGGILELWKITEGFWYGVNTCPPPSDVENPSGSIYY